MVIFPIQLVEYLESASIADERVIATAIEKDRLILPFDRDFGELIFKSGCRPKGVISPRMRNYRPEEPGRILEEVMENNYLRFDGHLTVTDRDKIRQRKIE